MNTEFQTEILTSQTFHILEEPRIFCSILFIKHSPQHIFYSFRLFVGNQSYGSIFGYFMYVCIKFVFPRHFEKRQFTMPSTEYSSSLFNPSSYEGSFEQWVEIIMQ
jgi:hypothetical protein